MSLQARFFKKGVWAERDCEQEWGVQAGHPCECAKTHGPTECECAQPCCEHPCTAAVWGEGHSGSRGVCEALL